MKKRYWQYMVKGRWPFPLDMLRRDRAQGANEEVTRKIELLSGENNPELGDVSLLLLGEEKPTIARWKSFGWYVDSTVVSVEVDQPLTDEEKLDLLAQLRGERAELGMKRKAAEDAQTAADQASNEVRRLRGALEAAEQRRQDAESDARHAREEVKEREAVVEALLQTLLSEE